MINLINLNGIEKDKAVRATFRVKNGATPGQYPIIVVVNDAGTANEEKVTDLVRFSTITVVVDASARFAGDINGDGELNIMDVIRLLKHVSNWNVEVFQMNADVTGDGHVDIMDVIRLLKFVSGWKVELI